MRWLSKWKITSWTAALILVVTGVAVFASGLANPFVGDDYAQIINSVPVHSIANIPDFFQHGTMYNGEGEGSLTGVYYRPMMTTAYALVYAAFGPNPVPFHVLQLLLHILGAFLVFAVFRYFFKPVLALVLGVVFLVHPINTQSVFAIATLQEPLFLVFGMTAMWILLRFKSKRSLMLVAACLLLSLLSKESGILFVGIALAYVAIFDRRRVLPLAVLAAATVALYLALKTHAVGLAGNPHLAPISELGFFDRLANGPAIIWLYLALFVFPLQIAYGYYWTYSVHSFNHFWLPLVVVATLILAAAYVGAIIRQRQPSRLFWTYIFFAAWLCLGLLLHLHIVPLLDMTASTTWFYFPMVGLLGMIGVAISAFRIRLDRRVVIVAVVGLIAMLGVRSFGRGYDWRSQPALAAADIAAGEDSYIAESILARDFLVRNDLRRARFHAEKSVAMNATASNTEVLGQILERQGDYARAKAVALLGIERQPYYTLYELLADISLVYPEPGSDRAFFEAATRTFPRNDAVWAALAVARYRLGDIEGAKSAISKAREHGDKALVDDLHHKIMNNQPLGL